MFSIFSKSRRRKAADHVVAPVPLSEETLVALKQAVFSDMAESGWVECRCMVRFEYKPEGLVVVVDVPGAPGLIVAADALHADSAEALQLTYKKVVEALVHKVQSELTVSPSRTRASIDPYTSRVGG